MVCLVLGVVEVACGDAGRDAFCCESEFVRAGGVGHGFVHGDEACVIEIEERLVKRHHSDVGAVGDEVFQFHCLAFEEHFFDDGCNDHDFGCRDAAFAGGEGEEAL